MLGAQARVLKRLLCTEGSAGADADAPATSTMAPGTWAAGAAAPAANPAVAVQQIFESGMRALDAGRYDLAIQEGQRTEGKRLTKVSARWYSVSQARELIRTKICAGVSRYFQPCTVFSTMHD